MDISIKKGERKRIHPQVFGLWIALASITMMFGAFTSAYIVRQAAGNWLDFRLPDLFFFSTAIILLSSFTLQFSFNAFKRKKESAYKIFLVFTLVLGIAFLVFQYQGWMALFDIGVDLKGNPSGSFLYLITAAHAAHILGGIAALVVAILHAFSLKFEPTNQRRIRFKMVLTYWHFVDLLWLYLLVFLLMTR